MSVLNVTQIYDQSSTARFHVSSTQKNDWDNQTTCRCFIFFFFINSNCDGPESKNFDANGRWFLWNVANSRSYKASAVTICYHLSRSSNTFELVFFQPETLLIVPAAGR